MTSVEYDLDTSGGLMEQILKLVAPPTSEDSSRKPKRAAREQRRSGRTVNHDCCDSCKEGGDLLCCDRCPAAFHLQCHDPPLTEDDVPSGEWVCRLCNLLAAEAEAKRSSKDGVTTTAAGGGLTAGVTALAATAEEMMEVGEEDGEEEDMNVDLEDCHPLMVLAKAARYTNPSQFELPKDIVCTQPLPGTSKRKWLKDSRSNPVKKLPHELDNGLVPLPAKLCFMCNKSCRRAPLIQCDFCSLLFHMDCLDPPLTTLPTGRWMCPNHPENFMDEKLLKSVSLSERIKLRAKFSGHINMHAIKIDFLKKIHRQSPPFRLKIRHPKRKSISIPSAIKDLYQNPPPLLPRASDSALVASMQPVPHTTHTAAAAAATNGAACTNGLLLPSDSALQPGGSNCVAAQKATSEEQEEWLASVVSLQTSIAKFLAQKQLTKSGDTTTTTTTTAANTTTSTTTTTSSPTATTIIRNIEETPSPATTTTSITTINCISEMMTAAVAATTNTIGTTTTTTTSTVAATTTTITTPVPTTTTIATTCNGNNGITSNTTTTITTTTSSSSSSSGGAALSTPSPTLDADRNLLHSLSAAATCTTAATTTPITATINSTSTASTTTTTTTTTTTDISAVSPLYFRSHDGQLVDVKPSPVALATVSLLHPNNSNGSNNTDTTTTTNNNNTATTATISANVKIEPEMAEKAYQATTSSSSSSRSSSSNDTTTTTVPTPKCVTMAADVKPVSLIPLIAAATTTTLVKSLAPTPAMVALSNNSCSSISSSISTSSSINISSIISSGSMGSTSSNIVSSSSSNNSTKLSHNNNNNNNSSSSSMLIQRLAMQPSVKLSGPVLGKVPTTMSAGNGTATALTKVIAVSTPLSVSKAAPPVSSSLSVSHSKSVVANTLSSSPAIVNLNTTLQHCIEGQGEVELGKLDQKLVQILAWQRLQQLLPQQQAVPSVIEKKRTGYDEIQARALLCPLTGKGEPISMPYRTLSIGTGADMDVCLTHFGHCNYVSAKHAYIFYDETTRHYELLNYSEHGTTADNVLYSCDFSEKTATIRQPTPFVASVRSIIAKRKLSSSCKDGGAQNGIGSAKDNHDSCGEENHLNNIRPTMSAKWRGIKKQCNCTGSGSSLIGGSGAGWEGTALLHHGSYIKTGCLQFVFSIVDHAAIDASNFVKTEPLTAVTTTPTTPATVELRS